MEKDLTAYVMVGAPGSGKSTFANELAESENAIVISGDDIRAELYGNADIQGNWVEIHDRIEELVSEACGMDVVLDGTHYRASYRKDAIAILIVAAHDLLSTEFAVCAGGFRSDTDQERSLGLVVRFLCRWGCCASCQKNAGEQQKPPLR